jgi:hypothetical protein
MARLVRRILARQLSLVSSSCPQHTHHSARLVCLARYVLAHRCAVTAAESVLRRTARSLPCVHGSDFGASRAAAAKPTSRNFLLSISQSGNVVMFHTMALILIKQAARVDHSLPSVIKMFVVCGWRALTNGCLARPVAIVHATERYESGTP